MAGMHKPDNKATVSCFVVKLGLYINTWMRSPLIYRHAMNQQPLSRVPHPPTPKAPASNTQSDPFTLLVKRPAACRLPSTGISGRTSSVQPRASRRGYPAKPCGPPTNLRPASRRFGLRLAARRNHRASFTIKHRSPVAALFLCPFQDRSTTTATNIPTTYHLC